MKKSPNDTKVYFTSLWEINDGSNFELMLYDTLLTQYPLLEQNLDAKLQKAKSLIKKPQFWHRFITQEIKR